MFYVLEGELTLRIGDDERTALPGTFACFPPGVAHTFSNRTDAQVRMLNFNTPSGWEDYMRELATAFAGDEPVTSERMGEIASRYDFRLA
jgi:quercetin dioxygenase-like cupin family protein